MFKKILFTFFSLHSIFFLLNSKVFASEYKDSMLPTSETPKWVTTNLLSGENWDKQVDNLSSWVVESIEWLLPLVAIGVFLFVGIKLAIAKWNPEEFKKAWMQFVYAIIGIFAVSFAWVTVKLVSGLSF